jgi:hypothetical protein
VDLKSLLLEFVLSEGWVSVYSCRGFLGLVLGFMNTKGRREERGEEKGG